MASIKAASAGSAFRGSDRSNCDNFTSASYNAPDNSSLVSSVAFRSIRSPLSTPERATSLSSKRQHAGAASSPSQRDAGRPKQWNNDRHMNAYTSATTTHPTRVESKHAKLHKRGGSGSSLPGSPSPLSNAHSQFTTPFATYEEGFQDMSSTPPLPSTSSTPRIGPYLRKISGGREDDQDQGRLDLSKSTSENSALAGLGIQEYNRSASEVTLSHTRRGPGHARNTSGGSQMSTGSGSLRPNQPFVHPMRQTPRPYTPPTGQSYASSLNDSEAQESDDVLLHDTYQNFRARRSTSISSTPQIQPTPLSQSYTASDLGYIPKLTTTHSETNLSVKSGHSGKSSKSHRPGRSRRNTDRSETFPAPSPSSRTSFDRAFSFGPARRVETEPQSRDERIRAARRKFEEKEAHKDRKWEMEALKRRETEEAKSVKKMERQRRRSSQHEERAQATSAGNVARDDHGRGEKEAAGFRARKYDDYRTSHEASLPTHGLEGGASEKVERVQRRDSTYSGTQSGWLRFSTWMQTRMLSCGGKT